MNINEQKPRYYSWKIILTLCGVSACLLMAGTIYFLVKCYNQNQFIYEQWADYNNKLISNHSQPLVLDENFDRRMKKLFEEVSFMPRSSLFNQFDRDFFNHRLDVNDLLNNSSIEALDKEYLITIAVPGFTKEQIKIELKENILTISADSFENSSENVDKKSINKFKQAISLNNDIDRDSIKSSLKDGILTINIARSKQLSEPKTIIIE